MAGLSICRGLDYGTGCSWWGTAAHLSPTTQSQREGEGERTMGTNAGQGDTGCPIGGVAGADVTPSLPIAQFGRAASSRNSLSVSKLLPFKNDGGHCVLGDLQC